MALFRRGESGGKGGPPPKVLTTPNRVYCRICEDVQTFTKCWMRARPVDQCEECGAEFETPEALYRLAVPTCPRCEAYLEQPGFEYGLCDGCGSKYELVQGTLPNLIPSKQQRDVMDRVGKIRRQQ